MFFSVAVVVVISWRQLFLNDPSLFYFCLLWLIIYGTFLPVFFGWYQFSIFPFSSRIANCIKFGLQKLLRELNHINVIFISFQGYSDIRESPLPCKNKDYDIWFSTGTFHHNFSLQVSAAPFHWKLHIFIGKKLVM